VKDRKCAGECAGFILRLGRFQNLSGAEVRAQQTTERQSALWLPLPPPTENEALVYEGECVVRYDTAHGVARIDILGRKSGLIEKRSCESLTTREAFQHAIHDLKTNYRQHLAFYLGH
jgi:hypothetical protein